jgi:hypothetical protein
VVKRLMVVEEVAEDSIDQYTSIQKIEHGSIF